MGANCSCEPQGSVAVLKIHAGKVNAFSHELIDELHSALDEIIAGEPKAVVLTGQEGIFSAGFDLKVMKSSPENAAKLIQAGGELLSRMYLLEKPLIIAASGHAVAMGAITLFVGDIRIGAEGSFKIGLNETNIGMVLPQFVIALAQDRLSTSMRSRAIAIGEIFNPEDACKAGFLDMTVPQDQLLVEAIAYGEKLGAYVDQKAFAENKRRLRIATLESVAGNWS